jgi:hypothetical protein
MLRKGLHAIVFGYFHLLPKGQQPNWTLSSARKLACLFLYLLLMNIAVGLAPAHMLDSFLLYMVPAAIAVGCLFFIMNDKSGWTSAQATLNKRSSLFKTFYSIGFLLALPCLYFLLFKS